MAFKSPVVMKKNPRSVCDIITKMKKPLSDLNQLRIEYNAKYPYSRPIGDEEWHDICFGILSNEAWPSKRHWAKMYLKTKRDLSEEIKKNGYSYSIDEAPRDPQTILKF